MYIENVSRLDKDALLSSEVMSELIEVDNSIERAGYINRLTDRAKELKCKQQFDNSLKALNQELRRISKEREREEKFPSYHTNFEGLDQEQLRCGAWIADESGVYTITKDGDVYACPHPIRPTGILVNAENGECKEQIAYKIRNVWKTITIPRSILASRSKIVALADYGIQVTSENAGALVRYLSDLEALNSEEIREHVSTSRLGWVNGKFVPYCGNEIIFDNEQSLFSLFNSVSTKGKESEWMDVVHSIRKRNRTEILIYMAASLASVLVEPCGCLPFIVSIWGGTGIGKTVALMLAVSIWADPGEGKYMADAKSTTTAMEIRLDALNSLPMCLDDMAQVQQKFDGDFSQLIYYWCQGKGRERSNQSLGLNKPTRWLNCTLTNGERSMISESSQGGAVNRVIDVEVKTPLFAADGNKVARVLKKNYGFCGQKFVDVVQKIGFDQIYKIYESKVADLKKASAKINCEKEEKQLTPMALILTADEIAEKHIYKDGIVLSPDDVLQYMWDKGAIDENMRAYELLCDTVIANRFRFYDSSDGNYEMWGHKSEVNDYEYFILPSKLNKILEDGGFQTRSFLSWAKRKGILTSWDKGKNDKKLMIHGVRTRYICIKIGEDDGFFEVADENIPF